MPLRDKLIMGPIEKYHKHSNPPSINHNIDRFPYKMLIQVILVILSTVQLELIILSYARHSVAQEKAFY